MLFDFYISSWDSAAADNAAIEGGLVRMDWDVIETSSGVYNWTAVDSQIANWTNLGKNFSLAISAGPATPSFHKTGTTVSYDWREETHTVPVPWDTTYINAVTALIQAAGARYANNPSLKVVYVPQASQNGTEGLLPAITTPTWASVGYTATLHADALIQVALATKAAFPNNRAVVELHENLGSADQAELVLAGLDPNKFGVGIWWVGQASYQPTLQAKLIAWPGPKYMQSIAAAANEPDPTLGYRLTGYDDEPWGLEGIRTHTLDLGGVYLEAWPKDVKTYPTTFITWSEEMADGTVLSLGVGGDTIATDDIGGVKHQRVKVEFGTDGTATEVAASAPLPTRLIGRGATVGGEGSVSFANSDPANTVKVSATIAMPSELPGESIGAVSIENPSTELDLTCRVYVQETFNGVVRWALVTAFNVPKSLDAYNPDQVNKISVGRALVQGIFTGENISIVLSNNTAVGIAGAFTARIKIRGM